MNATNRPERSKAAKADARRENARVRALRPKYTTGRRGIRWVGNWSDPQCSYLARVLRAAGLHSKTCKSCYVGHRGLLFDAEQREAARAAFLAVGYDAEDAKWFLGERVFQN